MRIVSLLPSATEILFALGAGDDVVGVTFECDHPPQARTRRIVSTSALPEGLSVPEIDAAVTRALHAGEDLYHLDEGALAGVAADLVVTQDLCAVCAVDVAVVDDALAHLGCRAEVLTTDPHTLEEVLGSVLDIGRATGRPGAAEELVARLRARLEAVLTAPKPDPAPRVLVLEWTDPPFAPGHWIPEMIEMAGGVPALGTPGAASVRVTWEQVLGAEPDVVVCAPCGYHLDEASRLAAHVADRTPGQVPVWAVDANDSWARPGPRLVDGVEALAAVLRGSPPDPAAARRIR